MKEKVEQFFASFPGANAVYATSNGILFTASHCAQAYADEQLDDKTVTTITRPAGEKPKEELKEAPKEESEAPKEESKEEPKEESEEEKSKAGKKNKSK